MGDGGFPANFSAKEIASGVIKVREARKAIGREGSFDVASMNYICVDKDRQSAIEQAIQTLKPRVEGGSFGRAKDINDAYSRCFLGNTAEISKQIEECAKAGVDHHVFTVLFRGGMDKLQSSMKQMANDIFRSFR